jgi:peptidyl-tRNA hydrolase, PTH1 family
MSIIIVGLGNPGAEYESTRHNAGRLAVELAAKKWEANDWKADKKLRSLKSTAKVGKKSIVLILPDTFMNNSGQAIKPLVTSVKKAKELVVVHDDIDLPLGTWKVSFNRGSGGHRGIESIIRAIKTPAFTRVRIGVSPQTPGGKLKKPSGDDKVLNFIIGPFKPAEILEFKKTAKKVVDILATIVEEGTERAMNQYN